MSKLIRFCACLALGLVVVACGDDPSPSTPDPVCGDGRVDPGETCDDGNSTDGDGCDTNCTVTACGNGIMTMDEGCDDGNDVDGDGCDSNCMVTGCGNGIVSDGETCDDGNDVNGDGCDNNCQPTGCGNGVMSEGEICDDGNDVDGDGCDSNCTVSGCGNGVVSDGEECDDGNTEIGDGCSATCEAEIFEVEPNDDGTIDTGASGMTGNDFSSAAADTNGAFEGSATIYGSLSPAGDEDVFAFTNAGAAPMYVRFDVWNMEAGFGVGVPCGSSIDTGLNIRNAAGDLITSNDDRSSTSDRCSGLQIALYPGQTVYAHLVEYGDNAEIASYALVAAYIAPVCGDMVLDPGEQCDDGNMDSGDGCSDTCQLEGAVAETEPNEDGTPSTGGSGTVGNDFASASADAIGAFTDSVTITAALSPAGDEDVFAFTNPSPAYVQLALDTWNLAPGYGIGAPCGTSINTGLHVRNAAGTSLASNDDRNGASDRCSRLSVALAPGETVYAHVVEYGDDAAILAYALVAVYTPVVCGDGVLGAGEQCDDNNTTPGDGCSDTCQLEGAVTEIEPNEDGTPQTGGTTTGGNDFASANADANGAYSDSTLIAASLTPAGDEDVFAFTNTGATYVTARFDTWNLAPGYGLGVSCGTSIDTALNIRNATGTLLASNGDRRVSAPADWCSGLEYHIAPGETVYAHIVEYGDNDRILSYALEVTYTPVVCGDGDVGPGEECDDGGNVDGDGCSATCQTEVICGDGVLGAGEQCDDNNTTPGDGCSDTCQLEEAVTEIEPNEDGTPSTGGSSTGGNDFASANADANGAYSDSTLIVASIAPAGDEDVFAFTNSSATYVTARLDTWNLAPGYGIGVPCDNAIDTTINIRDAAGTLLASNGDRSSSPRDWCSGLEYHIAPGETVYAHIVEYGDDDEIPSYALEVTYTSTVCGNGDVEPGEQCDDGGTIDGDGCSATCLLEGVVEELEPNDDGTVNTGASGITGNDFDAAAAQGPFSADTLIIGSLAPAGDEDVFSFTNPSASHVVVRFDTWNIAGGYTVGDACGTSIDTGLHIRDASGASLQSNNDRNSSTDRCAGLTYVIAPGATVYAHVVESGDNAVIEEYALEVTYLATAVVSESEPNDDGMVETGATGITGNDFSSANANGPFSASTLIVAALSPAGDEDVYAIANPSSEAVTVRVDIWRLGSTYGVGVPCGSSIDTGLHVRDASGTSLASNDDRSSSDWCSGLSYTIPAGETVYAHVVERGDNAAIPSYALEITFP